MATRISLSIVDYQNADIASLYQWLIEDPAIHRSMAPELKTASRQDGAMGGGVLTAIELIINEGATLGTLAVAIAQWLRPHQTPPGVSLEVGSVKVVVSDGQAESLGRALNELTSGQASDKEQDGTVIEAAEP
jgi:Effector Associated Constant Component 1